MLPHLAPLARLNETDLKEIIKKIDCCLNNLFPDQVESELNCGIIFCSSLCREEYENVAFVYVSDDMEWGRKNLKNEQVSIL